METRSSSRPLAAAVLATAVVLAAGALAPAAAAPARTGLHGRQPAVAAAAPTALSALRHWVDRWLAAAGLAPAPPPPAGGSHSAPPPTTQDDNGAGIDPNG